MPQRVQLEDVAGGAEWRVRATKREGYGTKQQGRECQQVSVSIPLNSPPASHEFESGDPRNDYGDGSIVDELSLTRLGAVIQNASHPNRRDCHTEQDHSCSPNRRAECAIDDPHSRENERDAGQGVDRLSQQALSDAFAVRGSHTTHVQIDL